MDEIIRELTHKNDIFEEQWPETFNRLENAAVPDDSKLVLHALVDYILAEPLDSPPCDAKYHFITMVVEREISSEIEDLVNAFIRVLNSPRIDQWDLHFLEAIYEKYQIGERLSSHSNKIQLIEKILLTLQTKTFKKDDEKWKAFLTEHVFSDSPDDQNRLNQFDMQTTFPTFCNYAIQQSSQSPIWLQIIIVLNCQISNEPLLVQMENFIRANKYDDARHVLLSFDFSSMGLGGLLRMIIRQCSMVENKDLFTSNFLLYLIKEIENLPAKEDLSSIFVDLILAILKLRVLDAPDFSLRLLKKLNLYSWKDLIDGLVDLIETCISYDTLIDEEDSGKLNELEGIIDFIYEKIPIRSNVSKLAQPIILETIVRWSDNQYHGEEFVYRMGRSLLYLMDPEQITEDTCLKFIEILQKRIDCDDEESNRKKRLLFWGMPKHLGGFIEHLKTLSYDTHLKLAKMFYSTLDHELYDEQEVLTFEHLLLVTTLFKTAVNISYEKDIRLYEVFLDRMYQVANDEEKPALYEWWTGFWAITGIKFQDVARDHIKQFLDYTLNRKDMCLISLLISLCMQRLEVLCDRFDALVEALLSNNGNYLIPFMSLFSMIVPRHPEIVSSKHLQQIFSSLETIPFNDYVAMIIQNLSSVANYQPDLFDNYRDKLIELIINKQSFVCFECFRKYLISSMIVHHDENRVNDDLNLLIDWLKNKKCSNDLQKAIVYTCLLIGLKYKQILTRRREDFVQLKLSLLVNYIDSTTTSKIEESTIRQAEQEMELIEQNIKKENCDINSEVIVPSWGREVTKLLNPRSNNDWRLLAQQLGFSSSEIKHWAMQVDPSMALLNEWFSTHRTDEAMYSLVKVLAEINRHDAEQIIRRALLTTAPISTTTIKRLPPVLLSFHSSEQILVTTLKDRLKEAGYSCQMDDEQTEINVTDAHIRGAKVVVCCIDTLYVQSENCAKQFHLILKMKKPFILLYMEEHVWPPEGTLQSILREYLYIPFSKDAKTQNEFLELIAQIRYYVAPDPDLISDRYRHWFIPRLDSLIFLRPSTEQKDNNSLSLNDIPLIVSHPQIILSYQWDHQKDALRLYKQLTQLGYRIWLDIFQMGGGDSLLEKYNVAIGESLCVLVCITPKYIKSTSCQHQFSLAKDRNKPIICLLVEETNPWPPTDMNLSVFAGKSYIDFRTSNDNHRWIGKPFEMLLAQLKKIIPNVLTDKPRHLLEMQRPISASLDNIETNLDRQLKRRSSAPIIPKSRACSLM